MSPKSTSRDKQAVRRLIYKIIALILIPIIIFSTISHIESLSDKQIADLLEIFNFSKFGTPLNSALTVFLLLLFGLFAFFPIIRLIQKFFSALTGKYFVISLAALAFLGGTAALYIPSYTGWFRPDTQQSTSSTQNGQGSGNQQSQSSKDPSSDLRLHLLYITGGIIAVLGLIETNRKNSQDHIREVHAARRDRYIKAVDKLSSEQAPVRLGGVYALVGLVDEWLDDDNIDKETRIKEGQIIINNLCSYIRSPFLTAEKIEAYEALNDFSQLNEYEAPSSFEEYSPQLQALYERYQNSGIFKDFQDITADYAKFHEEQDVRRTIFVEMSKRSSTFTKNEKWDMIPSRGTWSEFEFDFSRASIFYPLNHLTIEKGIFSYASFYGQADFNESTFIRDAAFNGVKFTQGANFTEVTFNGEADFSAQGDTKTTFGEDAAFNGTHFAQGANFTEVTFNGEADFSAQGDTKTAFGGKAAFNGTHFDQGANFTEVTFNGEADFSAQGDTKTTFGRKAAFGGKAAFNGTHFDQGANFNEVTFNGEADFSAQGDIKTVFGEKATFNDVQFHKEISFNTVIFKGIADFSTKSIEYPNETFMSDAEFVNTHFKKTANFSRIHSHSNNNSHKIYFKEVDFHEDSLFNDTIFQTDVHFEKAVFHGEAKFNDATFLKSVKFYNKTKFQNKAVFSGLTVSENTEFESVSFADKSYFNGATLGNSGTTNQQKTCFYNSSFDGVADFSNINFCSINEFIDLHFSKEVSFYDSIFTGDTSFIQHPNTHFVFNKLAGPKYNEKAEFSDAKFEGTLHFENIEFNDGADFIRTVFYEESNFENILFKNSSPDFKDAKFTVHSSHRFTTSQNSVPCRRKKVRVPRDNTLKARKIPIGSYLFDDDPDNPIAGPA